jgi:uncharacterized membrane protein YebE (DUF533 family)
MDLTFGRDTLLALAALAWADGRLDPREAAGIRSAAQQLGLPNSELSLLDEALKKTVTLDQVETVRMPRLTRLFTYAAACWVAEIDGGMSAAELAALNLLGDRLGLSKLARDRALGVARGNRTPGASEVYDLLKLRSMLATGLSQIGDE